MRMTTTAALVAGLGLGLTWLLGAGVARADGGYGGMGMGLGARLGGDLAKVYDSDGEVAGRIVAGQRSGIWAFEAAFFGTDLHADGGSDSAKSSTLSLGGDFKVFVPMAEHLEGYLRAGLGHTWMSGLTTAAADGDGPSYEYGAGLIYAWRSPRFAAGVWADYNHQVVRLKRTGADVQGSIGMLTFGFMVGTDL